MVPASISRLQSAQAAGGVLKSVGIEFTRVIRDSDDSILYLDQNGEPCTAWIHQRASGTAISNEPGFVDWPSLEVEVLAVPVVKEKS